MINLSIVFITLNEEKRLAAALMSLPSHRELIVLDSGSTDKTLEIAKNFGAQTSQRFFDNYANQKNAAIELATQPWVLSLDADEVLTPELKLAIEQIIDQNGTHKTVQAFRVRRSLVFMGKKMRFGRTVDYPVRLFRREAGHFVGEIHEQFKLRNVAKTGVLQGDLLHYSYENLTDYFQRFNNYTTKIAQNHVARSRKEPQLLAHIVRPWWEFFVRYVLKGGFLDGYPGYVYALISSVYAFIKYAKLKELLHRPAAERSDFL